MELSTRDLFERVDDLRLAAAAVTPVLEQLEAHAVDRKALAKAYRLLGLSAMVANWCHKQRQLLADGDDRQQQILLELLRPCDSDLISADSTLELDMSSPLTENPSL
jgi:hypothetical protein